MVDLQPQRGDDRVAIPFTFDSKYEINHLKRWKLVVSGVTMAALIIFWIVILIIAEEDAYRWWASFVVWVVVPTILRYALIGEYKYRRDYLALKKNNYVYDYSAFWNIYDTSTTAPTFFHHITGNNSVFVAFDKDVVVGKGDDSDFLHYDALSEAYNLLAKKNIRCIHIDYMDNVGKDTRLQGMLDSLTNCKSQTLQYCVHDMFVYMQSKMATTFSDYDVYCFTSQERIDLMYDDLEPVFNAFMNANYIRYRVLDRQDVRELVESVMGLPDFSVTRSCDNLFASKGVGNALKIIWTERDGVKEIVNKTNAEIRAAESAARAEKSAHKHGNKSKNTAFATTGTQINPNSALGQMQRQQSAQRQQVQRQQPMQKQQFNQGQQPVQRQQPFGGQQTKLAAQVNKPPVQKPVQRQMQQNDNLDLVSLFDEEQPATVQQARPPQRQAVPPKQPNTAQKKTTSAKPVKQSKQQAAAFANLNEQAAQRERAKIQASAPKQPKQDAMPTDDIIDLFSGDPDDDNIDLFG